ncbi:MAG TPA: PAS domain S-box protein [Mucilaginibacter sp.]|nr:PAS domain S-box protein [Mucilaginibacter sp.]
MTQTLKILHIEDVQSDAELVERTLRKAGIEFEKLIVDTRAEYLKALEEFNPDVILSDHSLPAFNSLEALRILKQSGRDIPFILITATVSEEFAVSVMKDGASDYVLKDRLQRLPGAVNNAIAKRQSDNDRQVYLNKIFQSEALFAKAELLAGFGTWRMELATNTTTWSAGTHLLLGFEKDQVEPSYNNFIKNIHSDDLEPFERKFNEAIMNAEQAEVDFRICGDGDESIRHLNCQFEFEPNESGGQPDIIGFVQDITRSKEAQLEIEKHIEELKAAGERQAAILNAIPPNVVLLNTNGKIVAVNDSWKKFTIANNLGVPRYGIGYSYMALSEKAIGVDAQYARKIGRGIWDVINGKTNEFAMEYSVNSSPKKIWFRLIVAPLTDRLSQGAVVLHVNITDRKEAEELMLQSRANLQTIFENTDMAYVLCDVQNKVVSFNSKANDLCIEQFGKTLKTGRNVFNYFTKNKIPDMKNAVQRILNNEMVSYETSYELRDGTAKWYGVKWVGIADGEGKNIGFMVAFKDITERKIADIERDRITADLVQRNRDLEQFTYIVSHNLRAPVANILGLSNMLNNFDFDINENQEIKTALATSITALDNMIIDLNQILQVSNKVSERAETIPFRFLIEDVVLGMRPIIESEHATIQHNFSGAEKIVAVKSYMHSIFHNLILNGIKYSRPGVEPVILISTQRDGNNVHLIFRDNGKGIDERNIKNLFGLYRRFDTSVEGKGMGLFMVKMQVETMGGKISVESEQGQGTTFIVELPAGKADE